MRVSEFIEELKTFIEERGDIDIICNDQDPTLSFYDEDDDGPFVVVE